MNIVLYTNSFLPHIGGRELVVHHLARSLHGLGHNVRVLGPAGWWRLRKYKYGYPVYRYPSVRGPLNEPVRLLQLLADTVWRGCDVIHAHATYPAGYAAARFRQIRNIPLILTPHGADIHTIPELSHGLRLDPRLRVKIDYAVRSADAVTAISDSIEVSLLKAGANPSRLHRIANGVDLERFAKPIQADVRGWLGVPSNACLVVTVGNYHPRKGHEWLIKIMPKILMRVPNARLIIVGRNTEVLKPLIDKLKLKESVLLTGPLGAVGCAEVSTDHGQDAAMDWLAALYGSGSVYVSAGLMEGAEGLSLALLEAMAAGVPVVATDISGNRDIVKDGENGYLVPPADAEVMADRIVTLLTQEGLRNRMSIGSREAVRHHGWTAIANRYVDLYQKVKSRHARRLRDPLSN